MVPKNEHNYIKDLRVILKDKFLSILFLCFLFLALPVCAEDDASVAPAIVSEINIVGNRLLGDDVIREQITTAVGKSLDKNVVIEDLKKIYAMGYFIPKTVEAQPFQRSNGTVVLNYKVEENPPVTDLIIYGNELSKEVDAYAFFSDLVGKPENARLISERIQNLERSYYTKGYIVARVKDIDLDQSGQLKIYIDEGNINEIRYIGNVRTQEGYLDHLVSSTDVDEPYNESQFAKDYKKIQGTGYFDNITRVVKPSEEGQGYVLEVQLKEKEKTTNLGVGGGVNSSAGLFGNVNLSKGNIHGRGETLNLNALIGSGYGAGSTFNTNSNLVRSGKYTSISASYAIPYFRDSDYTLKQYVSLTKGPNFLVDLSNQTLVTGGASVSRALDDNQSISYGTSLNWINIEDRDRQTYLRQVTRNILRQDRLSNRQLFDSDDEDFLLGRRGMARAEAKEIRDSQIISGSFVDFPVNYNYQNLDSSNRPRDGVKFRGGFTPTAGLGDVTSYTKLSGSISRFVPMPRNSTLIFNVRGDYGLLGTIPQFAKFRLGSFNGVRGYRQFTDLGVGDKLAITTTELRTPIYNVVPALEKYKILRNVDFALFADAGVIGGDSRLNLVTNRLSRAAAVGFGLRVNVPLIGALRFDVGFPLIAAITKNPRFYRFNFGPANFY